MTYLQNQIENLIRIAQEEENYEPYKETLEYVRGVDNSTFLTDFYPTNNTRVEFRALNIDSTSFESYSRWFIGARTGYLQKQFGFYFNIVDSPNKLYCCLNGKQDSVSYTPSQMYGDHTFMMDSTGLYVDGTKVVTSSATGSFTCDYPLVIGGLNNGGDITIPPLCDYTYVKIWESNVLVHDYIPALNNKMQPCLYDRVTKTFLYAITRDTKEPIYELSFKRWNKYDVDYLQSTGSQYIDSGLYGTEKSAFFADVMPTSQDQNSNRIMGNYATTNSSYTLNCAKGTGSISNACRNDGQVLFNSASTNRMQLNVDERHIVGSNNEGVWIDGELAYRWTSTPSAYTTTGKVAVLASSGVSGDIPSTLTNGLKGNCYGAYWEEDGVRIRTWKPSVRTYNDGTAVVTKAFMYDEVYNKAYDNAGTGSFKAYIEADREVYNLAMHDTMDTNGFYLAEDGTKTVSSDGTSCYTEAIQVKQGDIIEWTVTAEAVTANKRIHAYTTDADITTGQKGSWVEMLAKIVFSTTSDTTQTAVFTIPSGVNYIRLSHANTRETKDSIVRIRTYEVGKAIKYPQNNGFTLDSPNSSNFILDLLTRATTTNSYYMLDTRIQTGSSNEEEFGIGGSSTGSTVNWKCESETILIKTNGTNWARSSNYTYSHMLVGYKEGNTFKRTALFYDFNNQKTSDITIVTATRDIANNTKPLTVLHTTSSNWLANGAEVNYFKYLQDDNDVWYDCIPVRNATLTSSVLLFDRVNNTSLPNTGSGTPTFVALD